MNPKRKLAIRVAALIALSLSACNLQTGALVPPTPTVQLKPSKTSPPPTPTPTLTPTPTAAPPVANRGSLLPRTKPINVTNLDQIVQIARWGNGVIQQIQYSPQSDYLAVASSLGVFIHDVQDLSVIRSISTVSPVEKIVLSHRGGLLITGEKNGQVSFWDAHQCLAETGQCKEPMAKLAPFSSPITGLALSPDDSTLAVSGQSYKVELLDVSRCTTQPDDCTQSIAVISTIRTPTALAFSPDGYTLAVGMQNGKIELHDLMGCGQGKSESCGTLVKTFTQHKSKINTLEFSPDGALLASASNDQTSRVWRLNSGVNVSTFLHKGSVKAAAFSSDGKLIFTAGQDKTIRVWQVSSFAVIAYLTGHTGAVTSLAPSPDLKTLVSASSDGALHLWDLTTRKFRAVNQDYNAPLHSIRASDGGDILAAGTTEGVVQLYRLAECNQPDSLTCGLPYKTLEGHTQTIGGLSFFAKNTRLASASWDATLRIWDIETCMKAPAGEQCNKPTNTLKGSRDAITDLAYSPDKELLAAPAFDSYVRVYNTSQEKQTKQLSSPRKTFWNAAFSPDGQILVAGLGNGTIETWLVNDCAEKSENCLTPFKTLFGHNGPVSSIAFSPDGSLFASASWDHTIQLWQVGDCSAAEPGCISALTTLKGPEYPVDALTFSPDGKLLISAAADKLIRLWQLDDCPNDPEKCGQNIAVLSGHTDLITSLTFLADANLIVSASKDGAIRLWGIVDN
jgi:WD40 repeat protein